MVTKELPGDRWLKILAQADARVEYGTETRILRVSEIKAAIGDRCDGAIGQLTENWGDALFAALQKAGGTAYSNYAVGYNNVDVDAATKRGIPVGNTPGVLTEATAEMAVALTLSAARRVPEADVFMRGGSYEGWLANAIPWRVAHPEDRRRDWRRAHRGRVREDDGRRVQDGFHLFRHPSEPGLEKYFRDYSKFLTTQGESPVKVTRATSVEEVLKIADVVSLHPLLDETTHHLINAKRLRLMKNNAILVNAARGPVIDEAALVAHCKQNPDFKAALDVFEDEPKMKPGLRKLKNVVIVPHIASATGWTRQGMATLAASNVAAILRGWPVSTDPRRIPGIHRGQGAQGRTEHRQCQATGATNTRVTKPTDHTDQHRSIHPPSLQRRDEECVKRGFSVRRGPGQASASLRLCASARSA